MVLTTINPTVIVVICTNLAIERGPQIVVSLGKRLPDQLLGVAGQDDLGKFWNSAYKWKISTVHGKYGVKSGLYGFMMVKIWGLYEGVMIGFYQNGRDLLF